ncbi:MAG: DUF624 domain-containing protein [Clostridiales Family XIII bacterium]|jgi:uncharacterized membrane protein YesL|nr:DUF624 domain-containing protein [Clostridiales Family XIII bacterium]
MRRRIGLGKLDKPAPSGGVRRYFFVLATHFWKMVLLNWLFLLFSVPLITLPAALCATSRVQVKLIRDGSCFLWRDFIGEFRDSFGKSLFFGTFFGVGFFVSYYFLSLSLTNGKTVFGMLFFACGMFVFLSVLLSAGWIFVLLSMLPLGIRDIFRNARALAALEMRRSMCMLCAAAAPVFFFTLLFPVSLIGLALPIIPLAQYMICCLVYGAVNERVLKPYAASRAEIGSDV